ncbi:hypothetical protein ANCCAN_25608 [Ancylostoma caninum]|uniref:ATP-dependent DNA helicase n=1 Tax=Ancylostoma caninum TaxID=29170 RepID=A0A368FAK6_ANCCA|nr:hypothetical protein ANCCAN_25608 [Ancylostoma caninum]
MAYFSLVSKDEKAKSLTWIEVAEQYRFCKKTREYVPFKQLSSRRIARMWSVSPKLRELYAVRKLLFNRAGVTSFEALRTYNGTVYQTFMEAAKAAGYIETESEWEDCLLHASKVEMPSAIRRLFVQILLYCKPANVLDLWQKFKAEMRVIRKGGVVSEWEQDRQSFLAIQKIVTMNGMTIESSGLECVAKEMETKTPQCEETNTLEFVEENIEAQSDTVMPDLSSLNEKQRLIVEEVVDAVNRPKTSGNRWLFVYGKAGCGKTYTFNILIKVLESIKKSVLSVASTGIAATLLLNGRTAHSTFCIPVKRLTKTSVANIDASSDLGIALRNVDAIIWDETSLQSRYAVECVERLLRDMASPVNSSQPFGGVTMIFGGDWYQLLPVVPGGSAQEIINETLKSSALWSLLKNHVLDENMRLQKGQEAHAEWLRAVGEGKNFMSDGLHIELPESMCLPNEKCVIDWMYTPDVMNNAKKLGQMALLTVRNCDANALNELVLKKMPGELVELVGVDTPVKEDDGVNGMPCDDEEFLHQFTPANMPKHKLTLKKGAVVMLLRNIDISAGLCNGTRLEVLSIMCDNRLLYCRNLMNNNTTFITRMPLDYEDECTGIAFRRFQFPVKLAFCMTINKSQGQTFEKVGVILRTLSFAHGSTYVALSRSRSKECIRVTANWGTPMPKLLKIRNIVYNDVLE